MIGVPVRLFCPAQTACFISPTLPFLLVLEEEMEAHRLTRETDELACHYTPWLASLSLDPRRSTLLHVDVLH